LYFGKGAEGGCGLGEDVTGVAMLGELVTPGGSGEGGTVVGSCVAPADNGERVGSGVVGVSSASVEETIPYMPPPTKTVAAIEAMTMVVMDDMVLLFLS